MGISEFDDVEAHLLEPEESVCSSPASGTGHESSGLRTPRVNHPGEQIVGVMTIHPTPGQPHRRPDIDGLTTT
jgi:hypothetical protein